VGARAAGADAELTQNGVAAIAQAMGSLGGGADLVGDGAAAEGDSDAEVIWWVTEREQPETTAILANLQPGCDHYFFSGCHEVLQWLCRNFGLRFVFCSWADWVGEEYGRKCGGIASPIIGADAELTQNGVATIAHAMGSLGGGADLVGDGAAAEGDEAASEFDGDGAADGFGGCYTGHIQRDCIYLHNQIKKIQTRKQFVILVCFVAYGKQEQQTNNKLNTKATNNNTKQHTQNK